MSTSIFGHSTLVKTNQLGFLAFLRIREQVHKLESVYFFFSCFPFWQFFKNRSKQIYQELFVIYLSYWVCQKFCVNPFFGS